MNIGFIGSFGIIELLMIAAAVLLLAAFIASIVWVWRDAERRGQPGFIVAVLVAFLFWPFSLIVWLLARPQVGATPTAGRQRGVGGIVLLVVLLGIGLLAVGASLVGLGLPMIAKIRNDAQRTTCLSHVKEIAIAYLKYQDVNGRAPEYLAELGLRNLRCPSGTQSGPSTDPYELLPGTEPTDIIVRERWTNHGGKGGAIAFGDGSVAWVDSPYKPIRMDVVKAQVERQLREKLGEEFTKLGTVTFNAEQNRYDVAVELQIDGKEIRSVVDLSQVGAREDWGGQERMREFMNRSAQHTEAAYRKGKDLSLYAGSLDLTRRQGTTVYAFKVDELMEREDWAEKN
jgi:hypothetical protein